MMENKPVDTILKEIEQQNKKLHDEIIKSKTGTANEVQLLQALSNVYRDNVRMLTGLLDFKKNFNKEEKEKVEVIN